MRFRALHSCGAPIGAIAAAAVASAPISAIAADGWQMTMPSPADLVFSPISVSRQGFDATGASTTIVDTFYTTKRVRQLYPNQNSPTADQVAANDYFYSTDTVAGVVNNSTEVSPLPVAFWMMPGQLLSGNTQHWEIAAFHRDFRNNRQVACVRVRGNDGTTQTGWQTVAVPTLSTLCEDANPLEVFQGDLDVTVLLGGSGGIGAWWLEAEVYPFIGAAASVLKSEDVQTAGGGAREFTRRYFYKDAARAAAPPLAYVQVGGVDANGVWSTNAATAAATPFATVKGALDAIDNATRGTPATGGKADGCRIRIVDNTTALASSAVNRTQNLAALVVERAPGTTRANAVVTLSGAFAPKLATGFLSGITEGAIVFYDVTINRTANVAFTGAASPNMRVILWNVTFANGANAGRIISNAHAYYFGVNITGTMTGNFGQAATQHRLVRGVTVDIANGSALETWGTFGCTISRVKGAASADPTKGGAYYGNKFLNPDSTTAPIGISTVNSGETITGFVVLQNLFEVTHTTSSTPALRTSSDTPLHGNTLHVIHAHNTFTGYSSTGRANLFYDNSTEIRTHRLMRDVGNIYVQLNTKGDVFTLDATHVGQLAYAHGVGCQGNVSLYQTNSGNFSNESQAYPGMGSAIGTSTTVPLYATAAIWTDYKGTVDDTTAGAGGGTYTLQAASPVKGIVTRRGLLRDIGGVARPTAANDAAGAYAA